MATRPSRAVIRLLVVAGLVAAALMWAGVTHRRGADADRTALAIERAESVGFGNAYHLVVECAEDIKVEIGPDAGGSDLPQVTVWGRPRVGRCDPGATVSFAGTEFLVTPGHPPLTKIVDGATSQVVPLTGT